ncbi:MAG: hypothetical protein AW07_02647 [Candidatus Accumulibacter sp. SK-11]|nr:MAG: hypothetical protein AW07_02647 [Candidatus Accumulibacter sp. SK-11]
MIFTPGGRNAGTDREAVVPRPGTGPGERRCRPPAWMDRQAAPVRF